MQKLILPDVDLGPLIFEGVEKKLELCLRLPSHISSDDSFGGFRDVSTREWGFLLQSFGCQILNVVKNEHFDSYSFPNLLYLFILAK